MAEAAQARQSTPVPSRPVGFLPVVGIPRTALGERAQERWTEIGIDAVQDSQVIVGMQSILSVRELELSQKMSPFSLLWGKHVLVN